MIADWLSSTGLASFKVGLVPLLLPPVPLLALAAWGAWRLRRQRRGGGLLVLVALAGQWLSGCDGLATWLERSVLDVPPPLAAADHAALRARAAATRDVAIVVLGGGVEQAAPEYGAASLAARSLERLRYGLWLGRATGAPVAMTGGLGWAQRGDGAVAEATVGARIAAEEFGTPLRWREDASRDTRENARRTVALLAPQGVREFVVVTHGWHMPRALREFRAAAQAASTPVSAPITVRAAPIEVAPLSTQAVVEWMPSGEGALRVRAVWRELLGMMLAS